MNNIYIPDALPEMKIAKKRSWGADIVLHIYRTEQPSKENTVYTILSDYHGKPVGFYLHVFQPAADSAGKVLFTSMGDTSTNFLRALSDVYKLEPDSLVFADSVIATYTRIGEKQNDNPPIDYSTTAQSKLLFSDSSEWYLTIYENHNSISLPEKDSVFRRGIISAFSKQ